MGRVGALLAVLRLLALSPLSLAFIAPPSTSPSTNSPLLLPVRWSSPAPVAKEQDAIVDAEDATAAASIPPVNDDAFSLLAEMASSALIRSDMRRDAKGDKGGPSASGPSSATNWIDDHSAYA